ncbi:MAG: surface-adhesin E family protein [Syntrophales bacterium]
MVNWPKSIAVVIGLLAIFAYARVEGADWRSFGVFGPYAYQYDSESVNFEAGRIKVWVDYFVTSNESRDWVIQRRKKKGYSIKGYEDYTHSLSLWIIDCSNNKWGVLKGNDYDGKGRLLESLTPPKSINWLEIIPTSAVGVLRKVICR